MPASALDNPFAKQQKLLLYVLPLVFAVSGVNFPIGVLIYWFTTNVWSMCQQFYVIRRMPAPGLGRPRRRYHARLENARASRSRGPMPRGAKADAARRRPRSRPGSPASASSPPRRSARRQGRRRQARGQAARSLRPGQPEAEAGTPTATRRCQAARRRTARSPRTHAAGKKTRRTTAKPPTT